MEFDINLLLELLEFLRNLKNVPLPAIFERSRENLLGRVQIVLSPGDNYIDMKPGKQLPSPPVVNQQPAAKKYIPASNPTTSSFLYNYQSKITIDSPQKPPVLKSIQSLPHNGPSVHECIVPPTIAPRIPESPVVAVASGNVDIEAKKEKAMETEEMLVDVYVTMSLAQVEAKSYKFGELQRREKRFFFENVRPFWAAVIGSRFLSYDDKNDTKPAQVLSLKGSTCRTGQQIARSIKKFANSTFEICLQDGRICQFIAPTPKDMEEWMAAIQRTQTQTDTKQVDQPTPKASSEIKQQKSSKYRNISCKDYDSIIPDIVDALGVSSNASVLRSGAKVPTIGQTPVSGAKVLDEAQSIPSATCPLPPKPSVPVSKRMYRDLPPPPVATQLDDDANSLYNEIENLQGNRQARKPERQIIIPCEEEGEEVETEEVDTDENYDDVDNVRQQMLLLELKNGREAAEKTQVQSNVEQETYDDVEAVMNDVQTLREAEANAKAKAKLKIDEKDKRIPKVPPKIPARGGAAAEEMPTKGYVDNEQETYDDVEDVKNEVQILREAEAAAKAKAKAKVEACTKEKRSPPKVPVRGGTTEGTYVKNSVEDEQETYDDVADVKNEVQILRELEAAAKAKTQVCEKEKRTLKVPPKVQTKASPIKCFIDKIRQRNDSTQKENSIDITKQTEDVTAPGKQRRETVAEIRSDENSRALSDSYVSNQLLDHSDYNMPRTPRPVHARNYSIEGGMMEEQEGIYDDILEGTNSGNRMIGRDNKAEKRQKNDVLLTKYKSFPDRVNGESSRGTKKVVKILSESFNDDIYENQPRDQSFEGNSDFHEKLPIKMINSHPHTSTINRDVGNDDDEDGLYDDVQIVVQKSRAVEKSRRNLPVESPTENIREKTLLHPRLSNYEDDNIYDDCAPK